MCSIVLDTKPNKNKNNDSFHLLTWRGAALPHTHILPFTTLVPQRAIQATASSCPLHIAGRGWISYFTGIRFAKLSMTYTKYFDCISYRASIHSFIEVSKISIQNLRKYLHTVHRTVKYKNRKIRNRTGKCEVWTGQKKLRKIYCLSAGRFEIDHRFNNELRFFVAQDSPEALNLLLSDWEVIELHPVGMCTDFY